MALVVHQRNTQERVIHKRCLLYHPPASKIRLSTFHQHNQVKIFVTATSTSGSRQNTREGQGPSIPVLQGRSPHAERSTLKQIARKYIALDDRGATRISNQIREVVSISYYQKMVEAS